MQEGGVAAASYQCPAAIVQRQMPVAPMPMGMPVGGPSTMPTNYMPA